MCARHSGDRLSGALATIGGGLSQNSILWGSARYGVSAESVLALDVVLADGSLLATGAGALSTAKPFLRYYGPDLTGLFLGDTGALGIKARATLKLIRRPAFFETASFGFDTHVAQSGAMTEIAREGLVSECFGMDPVLQSQRMKRAGLTQDLKAVKGVITSARGLTQGLKEAAKVALAGRSFLDDVPYSMHVGTEGRTESAVTDSLAEVRRIVAAHGGREVENTIPKVMRGMRFVPMTSAIGPEGERWLPVHALVRLSDAAETWSAVQALFASLQAEFDAHGVKVGVLTAIVGSNAFVLEPVFYWPAPRTLYYERVLDDATLREIHRLSRESRGGGARVRGPQPAHRAVPVARRHAPADRPDVSLPRRAAARGLAAARGDQAVRRPTRPRESRIARAAAALRRRLLPRVDAATRPAASPDRNAFRVGREPGVEALQRRVHRARELDAACSAEVVAEVVIELEHVAEIVGAREPEGAIRRGRDRLVADLLPERPRQPCAISAPVRWPPRCQPSCRRIPDRA